MNDPASTNAKSDMLDIFRTVLASHDEWIPIRSRESSAGYRDVFVYQNQYLIKTYTIEAYHRQNRQPWEREHIALQRLQGLPVQQSYGYQRMRGGSSDRVVHLKSYIAGEVVNTFNRQTTKQAAKLLAKIHEKGVATENPMPQNFAVGRDEELYCVDFGRARSLKPFSIPLYFFAGRELAKFRRNGLDWDRRLWWLARREYFQSTTAPLPARIFIRIVCFGTTKIRQLRKILSLKSPRR